MSKILHCFLCLIFLGYTGVAMAATVVGGGTVVTPGGGTVVGPSATPSGSYSCPTYRKYSSCTAGYYLAYSYTGTSYNSIRHYSLPRAGNACRPCTDYDTYYNKPEGSYYCAGGKTAPVLKVTITYDLNGGDGSVPSPELCTPNSTCPLVKGNTTSFYRAGYVFKGWTPEGSTSDKVVDFDDFVPGSEDMTLYAVWMPCGIGKYKPGSGTQAAAACSSCPELTPGFEYFPATTNASLTECRQGITKAEEANEYCNAPSETTELFDIQCYATPDGTWGDCAIGNVWTAKPGSYVGIWKQEMPAEDVIENMCIPCGVGTYSEGGLINSCSSCPELTPGFEYAPLKRLTSIDNCTQVNYDISLINNNCTSLPGQESRPKINIRASAETGDWATYAVSPTEGAVYAVPGAYVNQDMMTNGEHLDISGFNASNLCVACTDATFSPGGDVHSCSACPSGYDANTETGKTSAAECQISCDAGTYVKTANAACTAVGSGYYKAAHTVNYGSTSTRDQCPTAYPNSDTGAAAVTSCYSNTKSRPWTGSQVNGTVPTNCSAVTEWGTCSRASCEYVAYSNSTGTADGTVKSGCETNADSCTKPVQAVSAKPGFYDAGTTCTACPSAYPNSADGNEGGISKCYMSVSGGKYVATANATSVSTCAAGTYKAAHTVYYGSTSSCSACTGRTKYSAAGASACSTVDSGYYSTGCNTSGNNCTGQSQCTGATYCSSGVQNSCPAQTSGWTRNGGTGWTSYTQCNQTRAATSVSSYCSAGQLKQTATSATAWGASTISTAFQAKAGAYVNGQTCSQCTADNYCTGGTAAPKDCPSGYPNSAAGAGAITSCYSNSKSRAWTGSQVNGAVPANCSAVTEWGTCSEPACSYVAYANSAGTGDGTIKSGCSTNNANCTKPVVAVSADAGYYDAGTTCSACPSGYPNSDDDNEGGITKCYSNTKSRAWTGSQTPCAKPTGCYSVTCNACSEPACSYVAYANSAGTGDGTIKSGCSSNNEACQQTVNTVTANAGRYVSGKTCPACAVGTFQGTDDSTATSCTVCAANTYAASTGMSACTACPSGYSTSGTAASNHDAKSDCSITCAAGTRVVTADAACTTPTGSWYTASHSVAAGSTTPAATVKACLTNYSTPNTTTRTDHDASTDCKISCAAGTRIATENATSCTTPAGNWYVGAHSVAQGSISSYSNCLTNYTISGTAAANHDTASDCKISCGGGSYIATANNTTCSDVGAGYWAAASTVSQGSPGVRNACDDGLTTIGSGAGADEAGDCGRVLNVNGEKIYLRSERKTTPSLNVSINGTTFYGNMGASGIGALKLNSGGTTYSVYDDSME